MKTKPEKRHIPMKNYVILGVIFIAVNLIVIYLINWYNVYKDYQNDIPVIRGTLSEITSLELDSYVIDNPTVVIYMCTATNETCREYEKDLKKLVEKEQLANKMIYLNLSDENQDEFINKFNDTYKNEIELTNSYPAIAIFENGKIKELLQEDSNELSITETEQFLNYYLEDDEETIMKEE